jgi:hypothetical protein
VIIRFVLPKYFSFAAEDAIRDTSAHTFDALGDLCDRNVRIQEEMDVVGHNNEGAEVVMTEGRASENGIQYAIRDPWSA